MIFFKKNNSLFDHSYTLKAKKYKRQTLTNTEFYTFLKY